MRLHPTFFDLIFCVLIVFVAIATQARLPRDESAERNLPPVRLPRLQDPAGAGATGRERATVSIVREGEHKPLTYFVDQTRLASPDAVVQRLRETGTARELLLRADAGVPYGEVLRFIVALSREGFDAALAYENRDAVRTGR